MSSQYIHLNLFHQMNWLMNVKVLLYIRKEFQALSFYIRRRPLLFLCIVAWSKPQFMFGRRWYHFIKVLFQNKTGKNKWRDPEPHLEISPTILAKISTTNVANISRKLWQKYLLTNLASINRLNGNKYTLSTCTPPWKQHSEQKVPFNCKCKLYFKSTRLWNRYGWN